MSDMTDRHLGEDATVTIPLRTALDLWMINDGHDSAVHDYANFRSELDAASREAGFDDIVHAFHLCGPGIESTADGKRGRRVAL